jgi:hypothetical protein
VQPGLILFLCAFPSFPVVFPTNFLNYSFKFFLIFDGASPLPRLKDNSIAKIAPANAKLEYTLIGCQGLFLFGVMLGSVNSFVDNFLKGS